MFPVINCKDALPSNSESDSDTGQGYTWCSAVIIYGEPSRLSLNSFHTGTVQYTFMKVPEATWTWLAYK